MSSVQRIHTQAWHTSSASDQHCSQQSTSLAALTLSMSSPMRSVCESKVHVLVGAAVGTSVGASVGASVGIGVGTSVGV